MGILTDYFAARPEQALAAADTGPGDDLAPFRSKFLEPTVLVGRLWAAIRHGGLDLAAEDLSTGEARVDGNDDEGPYLLRLKPAFVSELAALPDERIDDVAAVWRAAEEWMGEPDEKLVAGIVGELRRVARRAVADGVHAYCWICL
ncbi:hypothetical protein Q2K19_06130 [Micromonospora soli]|uniref:hypothetical protein n=1 Tax=Micromonospora sp. NBRC 110009 TaxID=3061627 RepID=UPI002671955A|nr:hypothetical protein [Micromonospora sp. NBRC 110009]WKU00064.1 hypothetical protein Q2K19_06130 [Micromonospora sp. NBRC 110009]